jgi:ABC-2 type transport system ATP-binding protein
VARRPALLVLDEPLASLDPLARHDCMASLMAAVAEDGLSVVLSSHVIADLERLADYLIVLSHGQVQVAGEVEELLAEHSTLTGPAAAADDLAKRLAVVHARRAGTQAHVLVRSRQAAAPAPPGWEASPVGLGELVLACLREPGAAALPGPAARAVAGARREPCRAVLCRPPHA